MHKKICKLQRHPNLYYYVLLLQFNKLKQKTGIMKGSKAKYINLRLVIGNATDYAGYFDFNYFVVVVVVFLGIILLYKPLLYYFKCRSFRTACYRILLFNIWFWATV